MRTALLAILAVAATSFAGCTCNHPTSFWWNTRLVPATANAPVTTGTGFTEAPAVAVMPMHEAH